MKLPEELQFIANARKPQKRTDARLDGKACLITGATSGVGLAAARRLARGGADLILLCRNPAKAEALIRELEQEGDSKIQLVLADFSDLDQVRAAASRVLQLAPRLDVLINNIGIHNTRRRLTSQGLEEVFCVNHLAPFLLTQLLLERILDSAPSRIIYVNSEGHRFGGLDLDDLDWEKRPYRGLQGYGAAKVAQLLTVWELADRLQDQAVTVNAMHPGAVATNIGMNNGWLYRAYQKYLLFPLLKGPEISGEAIYYFAASPEMAQVSGRFYNQTIEEIPAAHALDRELGQRVWKISLKLTGLDLEQSTFGMEQFNGS